MLSLPLQPGTSQAHRSGSCEAYHDVSDEFFRYVLRSEEENAQGTLSGRDGHVGTGASIPVETGRKGLYRIRTVSETPSTIPQNTTCSTQSAPQKTKFATLDRTTGWSEFPLLNSPAFANTL